MADSYYRVKEEIDYWEDSIISKESWVTKIFLLLLMVPIRLAILPFCVLLICMVTAGTWLLLPLIFFLFPSALYFWGLKGPVRMLDQLFPARGDSLSALFRVTLFQESIYFVGVISIGFVLLTFVLNQHTANAMSLGWAPKWLSTNRDLLLHQLKAAWDCAGLLLLLGCMFAVPARLYCRACKRDVFFDNENRGSENYEDDEREESRKRQTLVAQR